MNPVIADELAIHKAANLLRQGCLVAFPTETVYGLGADAKNPAAVKRIFAAKGRPADHPLIVHIANFAALDEWAIEIPGIARQLADHFWPGPLTLVLNKRPDIPMEVTGGQATIALRIPAHPVALSLLRALGGGIAAPSANRYCRISPTQASHVLEELGDAVDLILDGGACQVGLESTIVDLSGTQPRLLRPGQINKLEIEELLQLKLALPENKEKIHAPGMMEVHYAPITRTVLCSTLQLQTIFQYQKFQDKKIGVVNYSLALDETPQVRVITMPREVDGYAHALYGTLRKLDRLGLDIILIEQPPQKEAWRAINDRLGKAAKSFPENEESSNAGRNILECII